MSMERYEKLMNGFGLNNSCPQEFNRSTVLHIRLL